MADTYDLAWLQNWVSQQVHTDDGNSSYKVFSEIVPNFPNHTVMLGPKDNSGNFHFSLSGNIINGTFTISKS